MPLEEWNIADRYENYVGRWSRRVVEKFLPLLKVPLQARWLDVGCGSGALTGAILQFAAPAAVHAYDASPLYVAYTQRLIPAPNVYIREGDAHSLPEPSASFDAAVSGLVLNFLAEPPRAVAEMVRLVKLGGVIGAYVWDYAGKMQFMRYFWDAAAFLDPEAADLDEGARFPLCQPEPLEQLFLWVGMKDVSVAPIDVETRFRDFDDFWGPFLGGQGPAPGYVATLEEDRRVKLRELLRSRLPFAPDGSISLTARAWAVWGSA